MSEGTVEAIRRIAREHGWAIAAHGSMDRDIDLVAVPWTAEATHWRTMLDAVRDGMNFEEWGLGEKPCGRLCVLLRHRDAVCDQEIVNRGILTGTPHPKGRWFPACIDLSIIDPRRR